MFILETSSVELINQTPQSAPCPPPPPPPPVVWFMDDVPSFSLRASEVSFLGVAIKVQVVTMAWHSLSPPAVSLEERARRAGCHVEGG